MEEQQSGTDTTMPLTKPIDPSGEACHTHVYKIGGIRDYKDPANTGVENTKGLGYAVYNVNFSNVEDQDGACYSSQPDTAYQAKTHRRRKVHFDEQEALEFPIFGLLNRRSHLHRTERVLEFSLGEDNRTNPHSTIARVN